MPISVEWLIKDRVILSSLDNKIKLNEVTVWLESKNYMADFGMPLVHHIADIRQLEIDLHNPRVMQKLRYAMPKKACLGSQVVITSPYQYHIAEQLIPYSKKQIVPTLDDALEFLYQQDVSLDTTFRQSV